MPRKKAGIKAGRKNKGYDNIVIREGTNSGYYRNNISAIARLKVDELPKYYGIKVIDFNKL